MVPMLFLFCVALSLYFEALHVWSCPALCLCVSSVFSAFWSPCLRKRELVFVLIVHWFVSYAHVNLCHFFLFLLVSGAGCGFWLWLFLDFSVSLLVLTRRLMLRLTMLHVFSVLSERAGLYASRAFLYSSCVHYFLSCLFLFVSRVGTPLSFYLLAHLSRRLTRWAYSIPMVRRPSVVVVRRRPHFQT